MGAEVHNFGFARAYGLVGRSTLRLKHELYGCPSVFCGIVMAANEIRPGNDPTFEAVKANAPGLNSGGEKTNEAVLGLSRSEIAGASEPMTEIRATNRASKVELRPSGARHSCS